jgi:uncharacterized protein (DUF1501 family)
MAITRRDFLKSSAAAAAALTVPHPIFRGMAHAAGPAGAIVVILQMEGGNDGLNMVTPIDGPQRGIYDTKRPNLQIPAASLLPIDDDPVTGDGLGLHPSMPELHALYGAGRVAVVNGVGYAGQSLSHFRSEDIWFGGTSSSQLYVDGWFGRYLEDAFPGGDLVTLDCDNALSPIFFCDGCNVLAIKNLSQFAIPDDPLYPDLADKKTALQSAYADEAASASGVQLAIGVAGDALLTKMDDYAQVSTSWGSNLNGLTGGLAARLKQVASVIRYDNGMPPPASPTGARFFHVRIGGFDTHTKQGALTGRQPDLLAQVSKAIKAFYDDMVALGVANKVLILTFSEFGRRVAENGSPTTAGTDHGAAAPLFVVGDGITTAPGGGYVFGRVPPLDTGLLENGRNLAYHTDFRRVYATVIDDWLNGDSAAVLGGAFASVGFVA